MKLIHVVMGVATIYLILVFVQVVQPAEKIMRNVLK